MFPFFSIESSFRIRLLSMCATQYNTMGLIAYVLSSLPIWLRLAVVQYVTRESSRPPASHTFIFRMMQMCAKS